jgi:hypothetical protein
MSSGNSFEHFEDKTVNENHNTRVAILSAQLYSCGAGVESKLSTTTGQSEIYVAIRLGQHLIHPRRLRNSKTLTPPSRGYCTSPNGRWQRFVFADKIPM